MRIGFIGLGLIGRLMTANLAKAGHTVRSYDLNGTDNCRTTLPGLAPGSKPLTRGAR